MSTIPTPLPPSLTDAALDTLTAGLSNSQLLWLSGYFYGRAAGAPATAAAPVAGAVAAATAAPAVTVLYGSHTGNGAKIARLAVEEATRRGLVATAQDMNEYAPRNLAREQVLLVIVSTHGEGDPPVAAEELHQFLASARAPRLPGLRYAVLALGDKSYLHYCQTGKDFDERLAALGAQRLLERTDVDVAWKAPAAAWTTAVLDTLTAELAPVAGSAAGAAVVGGPAEMPATEYTHENPWAARVLASIQLNGRGSTKETHHLELDVTGSGLHYEPGDALAVLPANAPNLVDEVLQAARLSDTAPVALGADELPLAAALATHRELTVLTRDVVERYAHLVPQHKALHELAADARQLQPYLYGRDVADLLTEFPADGLTAQALVDALRPLPGRAYSIASSLLAHPDEVHLTVGAVRYETNGRRKQGVCSSHLAERLAVGDAARVFVERNEYFKLPKDAASDLIMVGAGTGVAPFRAFVEERVELGATGRNWLLFGNPHFTTDFLYQTEWLQHLKRGGLSRLDVAFSRDQAQKVYVQDRLLAAAPDVWAWLQGGATFYVCGDKAKLGTAVQQALAAVAQQQGGLSADDATAYVRDLRKRRRYLEDVY